MEKNAIQALGQADGTIRTLRSRNLRLTNDRGRSIDVEGEEIRWIALAVLDHPNAPRGVVPDTESRPNPSIVLVRRDWEFVFAQLKSTHAVGRYFERVIGESWELGGEAARYLQLADADAHASPQRATTQIFRGQGRSMPPPQLPLDPAGSGEDELPHVFLRLLYEDIATGTAGEITEENRLRVLAELDRLAVQTRALMGEFLLRSMEAVAATPAGQVQWRARSYASAVPDPRPLHLAFAAGSHEWDDAIRSAFTVWVQLRHHQMAEAIGRYDDLLTVAIAVTPRTDGRRPWDTSMIAAFGDLALTPEEIREYEGFWPWPSEVITLD